MGSPERGILYVCDMGAAPELALSVYSARQTNPDIPITVISLGFSDSFRAFLQHMNVQVLDDLVGNYDAMYAQKRFAYLHCFYDRTFCIDADTVVVAPLEDSLWQTPSDAIKVHRIPWIPYTHDRFLPVYEVFPPELQARYPLPPREHYEPVAVQAGTLLLTRETHPVLKDFFGSITQEIWNKNNQQKLAGEQGLLRFVCQSKNISIKHLDRRYNFYCNYFNQETLWGQPAERTFEISLAPAIIWQEAIILHYNVHWPQSIPRRSMRLAALRAALKLMDQQGICSSSDFRKTLARFDSPTVYQALDTPLPVPQPVKEGGLLTRTHKKIYQLRRNVSRAVAGSRRG